MSYKRNIMSNFVTQITVVVISFFVSIVVNRVLGPTDKGYVTYLLLCISIMGEYGHLGITYATSYFQKKAGYKEEEVFNTNLSYLMILSVLISFTVFTLKICGIFIGEYSWKLIIMGILIIITTLLSNFFTLYYTANERIVEINRYNLIMNLTKSFLIILFWIIGKLNVFTFILFQLIPVFINMTLLSFNSKQRFKFSINKELILKEFKFGFIIYISTLFIYLNYKIDQFFIKNWLDSTQLGIYTVAVTLAELLFIIPGSVGTAILGRLYNINNEDVKERKHITAMTVKYTFYICLILGGIGICMTPLIPFIYGNKFATSKLPTVILFIGIIFAAIGRVSSSYFQSKGTPKIHLIITFSVFLINIVLNIWLIPIMGITGAALASTISYCFYGITYVVVFVKKEGFTFKDFFAFDESDKKLIKEEMGKIKRKVFSLNRK